MSLDRVFVYTYLDRRSVLAGAFANKDGLGYFQYAPTYLGLRGSYPLDPIHLPLQEKVFHSVLDGGNFGTILDSCSQEWGRLILNALDARKLRERRRLGIELREVEERYETQHELLVFGSGYGVGALRFSAKADAGAAYLDPVKVPKGAGVADLSHVRRLAVILAAVNEGKPLPIRCQQLLVPGMSLGGARPKGLVDFRRQTWIAKFSRPQEIHDIPRVEYAINRLALKAGLRLAESELVNVRVGGRDRGVFLSRRFDRDSDGTPLHYISAATLLNAPRTQIGMGAAGNKDLVKPEYSYMSVAQMCRRFSSHPKEDGVELFRRMAFNALVGNRDDHLCNHGLLKDAETPRYRLAPAFDIALDPLFIGTPSHSVYLGEEGRSGSVRNVLSRYGDFGIATKGEALDLMEGIAAVVDGWLDEFKKHRVAPEDTRWVNQLIQPNARAEVRGLRLTLRAQGDTAGTTPGATAT